MEVSWLWMGDDDDYDENRITQVWEIMIILLAMGDQGKLACYRRR